jgi:hypothetical protein
MSNLQFAVRELEKAFFKAEYLRMYEEVMLIDSPAKQVGYLQGVMSSNSSSWSGGQSATNLEEQTRREIAIDILRTVAGRMMYEEVKLKGCA